MPPDMVSVDLPGICPPKQGCRINLCGGGTHGEDSAIPSDRKIMQMIASREILQLNVDSINRGADTFLLHSHQHFCHHSMAFVGVFPLYPSLLH
jgi:hypothetical protein